MRLRAGLAAAWAIVFAAPHVYWATGRKEGLDTALNQAIVRNAGAGFALGCAGIALFCLCGAAVALATLQSRYRRPLIALLWFGAALLILRSMDIFVEFGAGLTDIRPVPTAQWAEFQHLGRWFLFCYLPWFVLGAVAWTRLAWRYTRRSPLRPQAEAEWPADWSASHASTTRLAMPCSASLRYERGS